MKARLGLVRELCKDCGESRFERENMPELATLHKGGWRAPAVPRLTRSWAARSLAEFRIFRTAPGAFARLLGVALLVAGCGSGLRGEAAQVELADARRARKASTSGPAQSGVELGAAPGNAVVDAAAARSAGRWLLLPDNFDPSYERIRSDGVRELIVGGMRIVDHPDGSLEQAESPLPVLPAETVSLPARLGGGYVFHASGSHTTWLWRAEQFTAPLVPLARVDPELAQVVAGFDRLYLISKHTHQLRAIDAHDGHALDAGSLPATPSFGGLGFLDEWVAVVASDVRGLLATFDAGASWHGLGVDGAGALNAETDGERLSFDSAAGRLSLSVSGELRASSKQTTRSAEGDAAPSATARAFEPLDEVFESKAGGGEGQRRFWSGRRPLLQALLHGVPARTAAEEPAALVWFDETLAVVRLSDGRLVERKPAPRAAVTCRGIELAAGYGFACSDEVGKTELYALESGPSLRAVQSFAGPRAVHEAGQGGVIVRGPCRRAPSPASRFSHFCLRARDGKLAELGLAAGQGASVGLLPDGRQVLLEPPSQSNGGALKIDAGGRMKRVPLDLSDVEAESARLLKTGSWSPVLQATAKGELRGWVMGGGPFVGVSIELSGKVRAGTLEQHLDRALIAGPRALALSAEGQGRETGDFGFDWRDISLPPKLGDPAARGADKPVLRGCSMLGCVVSDWLLIGAGPAPSSGHGQPMPELINHGPGGYSRWTLECGFTGATSPIRTRAPASARGEARAAAYQSTLWLPFFGNDAPDRNHAETLGFEQSGSSDQLFRAYVWGPRDGRWDRRTEWMVRVADPFQVARSWSTRAARSPWSDVTQAAQVFGQDQTTSPSWKLDQDPAAERAILLVRSRGATELYLLAAGQRPRAVANAEQFATERLAGVTVAAGTWYFGLAQAQVIKVYRMVGDQAVLLGSYPQFARDGRVLTRLVGSSDEAGLALWSKASGAGWHVFPLDPASGEAFEPFEIKLEQLREIPAACEVDAIGYEVASQVPLTDLSNSRSNTQIEFVGTTGLGVRGVSARLSLDESGVCIRDAALMVEGLFAADLKVHRLASLAARPIQLTATDPDAERQAGFACRR